MLYKIFTYLCLLGMLLSGKIFAQNYPVDFDVRSLNGTNGFTIIGSSSDFRIGNEVQFVGDINNDGFDDIAISNDAETVNSNTYAGRLYVIFGSGNALPANFNITDINGTNGFIVEGVAESERCGETVAGPGDINGDGIDDLIVGAEVTMVIYGARNFPSKLTINNINGTNGFKITVDGMNQVAKLGDVNGDNINDFILGRPTWDGRGSVFFGRSSNFPSNVDLTWLDGVKGFETDAWSFSGIPAFQVGGAGDLNDDGYNDILIGNWAADYLDPLEQVSYAFFGRSTFNALEDLTVVNGTDGFKIDNRDHGFLTFVGPVGDVNGDGIDDCFSENNVIFGSRNAFPAFIQMTSLNGSNGFVLENDVLCAAPTGDVNIDGIDDFIVYGESSFVVYGTKTGFPATLDEALLDGSDGFRIPNIENTNVGRPVDGGGDFNGDGLTDYLVGNSGDWRTTGKVYVVLGGDHIGAFTTGYPKINKIAPDGFSVGVNTAEKGELYYAVYYRRGTIDNPQTVIDGTGATQAGHFSIGTPNVDIPLNITGLVPERAYDLYVMFVDEKGNWSELKFYEDLTTISPCIDVPCSERDAIMSIYYGSDGSNWTNNTNWMSYEPVGDWYGVTVRNGHVVKIELSGNNLDGGFTSLLNNLHYLEILDVSNNPELFATLPYRFFEMSLLREVDFSNCGFYGMISIDNLNMPSLEKLDLSSNGFVAYLPDNLFNITSLKYLDLSHNQFSSSLKPLVENLTSLEYFAAGDNYFSGDIPITLGNMSTLKHLDLSENRFTGGIPLELGSMSAATYIDLHGNQLEGGIPTSLASMSNLKDLILNDNDLSGTVPDFTSSPTMNGTLAIDNNAFQFGDFESQWSAYQSQLDAFNISPQADLESPVALTRTAGQKVEMTVNASGSQNTYQWYKDGVPVSGATSAKYTISSCRVSHAGTYYCIVSNTIVTDLTLLRADIQLNVQPDTYAPVIYCPSSQTLDCKAVLPDYTSLATVSDNVDPAPVVTQTPAVGSAFVDGMTITLKATDFSNNSSTCSFVVNMNPDNTPPQITCIGDQYLYPGSTVPDYTGLVSSTDNCSSSPVVMQSPAAGTAYTNGMTVTMTSTDESNNAVSCSFKIYDRDETPPVISNCPANETLLCGELVPDYIARVTVTDNLDPSPVVTQNPIAGSAFVDGMTITITAKDFRNNSVTCSFVVNLEADVTPPEITCPGDQLLNPGDMVPDYTALATTTDNCTAAPVITQSPVAGTAYTKGMTVILTSTDESNNKATCSFTINNEDNEAPEITNCPGEQQVACYEVLPDYTSHITVTDNKDPNPVISQSPVPGSVVVDGMTITLTVKDFSANEATCSFDVKVAEDNTPPQLTCPGDQYLNPGDMIPDYTAIATSSDNCTAAPVITQSPAAGTAYTKGMTVTLTSTDENNNSATCSFVINNEDSEAPVIANCPDQQQVACHEVLPDYLSQITVTDNKDPHPVMSQSPVPGSMVVDGMTVTITVKDFTANEAICSFEVYVAEDNTPPQLTCPGDQYLNPGDNIPDYTVMATSSDNCTAVPVITQSPVAGTAYTKGMTVTLTSTDENNNSATCSFNVHNQTGEPPVITNCSGDQLVACGDLMPDYLSALNVTDDTDPAPALSQTPAPGSDIVDGMRVTLTATDFDKNTTVCSFIVNVAEDNTPPQITCPGDQNLKPGDVLPDYTAMASSTDNCSANLVITQSPVVGSAYTSGMTVTLTSTDENDNAATCTFNVYDRQGEAPKITNCLDDQVLACGDILPDYSSQITVTDDTDPNPVITQNPSQGSAVTDGMSVTLTATDKENNATSCSFIVNVAADNTPPEITCPGDQYLKPGTNIPDYTVMAISTDNCSASPVITQSPAAGSAYTTGMTVTLTSTDERNNAATCSFIIHDQEGEAPVITNCPEEQTLSCGDVLPDYADQLIIEGSTGNDLVIVQTPDANTVITEDVTVVLEVTNAANQRSTCTFDISVAPVSLVDAGPDVTITEGERTQLNATAQETGTYTWTPVDYLDDPNVVDPLASPFTTTIFKVTFTNEAGCSDSDELTVTVKEEKGILDKYGITPNGDGINDTWQIGGIDDYSGNMVSIYNRWGVLVFEMNDYNNSNRVFGGHANKQGGIGSKELPDGTYFFSIKLNKGEDARTGFIVIKR